MLVYYACHNNREPLPQIRLINQRKLYIFRKDTAYDDSFITVTVCSYMATASVDRTIKIWDMRNSYQEVFSSNIRHGAGSLSFSQRGLLAAGIGDIVQVCIAMNLSSLF